MIAMALPRADRDRRVALPLRAWLAIALVAIVALPTLAQAGVALLARQPLVPPVVTALAAELRRDAARWGDPAWQATLAARIAGSGVQVVLLDPAGRTIWRNDAGLPTAPPPVDSPLSVPLAQGDQSGAADLLIGTVEIVVPGPDPAWSGRALLSFPVATPDPWRGWLPPLAALLTLVACVAVAALLLGRAVLRPLAALASEAERIAAGARDPRLPRSPVREIAAVGAAFTAMGAALREADAREAALDGERRFFIGAVAHDLRTPLFALRGYLDLLARGAAGAPAQTARYLANSRELAETLERLIGDLFAYARIELLHETPRRETRDLGATVRRGVEDLRARAAERGIAIGLDGPPAPCPVAADHLLLARALGNLLDNALRHTPDGGLIAVRWDGGSFAVADSGPGIAAEDLPHLFTPLYRADRSRSRQTGGAGLGLAIARRILAAHGGTLTVANGATGAIFTATLGPPGGGEDERDQPDASSPPVSDAGRTRQASTSTPPAR